MITPKFPTYFHTNVEENLKRKIILFILEKCIEHHIGGKPRSIKNKDITTFLVKVGKQCESKQMYALKDINGVPVKAYVYNSINVEKGFIHIYGYSMTDLWIK